MHTQAAADDPDAPGVVAASIPVGFPGRSDHYQRRIGPEGEEADDLIGPYGHREQLPPYTQEPPANHRAAGDLPPPHPARLALVADPTAGTAPVQGAEVVGLAAHRPALLSGDDLSPSSGTRRSARSFVSDASGHEINTAARRAAEEKTEKPLLTRARRKVCGNLPCWALCLGVVVLICLGVALAVALALLVAKGKLNGGPPRPSETSAGVDP